MTKKLIDTSVLVHAFDNSDQEKHFKAKEAVKKLSDDGNGILSVQNLTEFSRALSEKAKYKIPYDVVRSYVLPLGVLFPTINYDQKTIAEALYIASNYNIHFFDALLAATMEANFISEIVTENEKDFSKIPWLKVINPFKQQQLE